MVYNGEIYNFKSLKNELISKNNIIFDTDCDTEVILELFLEYGIDFLEHVEGMFSICIYDKSNKKIYLIRDRIGEKPLFYFHNNDQLIFSSELKSLLFSFPNLFSLDLTSLAFTSIANSTAVAC